MLQIDRSKFIYTPCYCEENVWKLCEHVKAEELAEFKHCFVIFISNSNRTVKLWQQKAAESNSDTSVIWDYHVILVHGCQKNSFVFDFDTLLDFPCEFGIYCRSTFRSTCHPILKPMFRVIKASEYLATFASSRVHMKALDGSWLSPPPNYPPIRTSLSENNIQEFIAMTSTLVPGRIMDFTEFLRHFQFGVSGDWLSLE